MLINFKDFYHKYPTNFLDSSEYYIAEVAGKDSIAAIVQIAKNVKNFSILGIGINHRSFFGNLNEPLEHFEYITTNKSKFTLTNTQFMYLDVSSLFDLLIVRTMAIVQKYFHYYSPCPACHLFFHMMRVPIARHLSISRFITGERDFHGTRKKLNQLPEILDLFKELLEREKIHLLQPLKSITQDKEIFTLLGKDWSSATPYKCSFSGNYYDENGQIPYETQDVLDALIKFYYPLFHETITFIETYHEEPSQDWVKKKIKEIVNQI